MSERSELINRLVLTHVVPRALGSIQSNGGVPDEIWSTLPISLRTRIRRFNDENYEPSSEDLRAVQSGIIASPELAKLILSTDEKLESRVEKEDIAQHFPEAEDFVTDDITDEVAESLENTKKEEEKVPVTVLEKEAKKKTYNEDHWAKLYLDTKKPEYKDKAVIELKPIINKFVNRSNQSKSISHGALFNKGLVYVSKAIDDWDPNRAKLSTHVTHGLKKLYRDINKYGPILHTPEHRIGNWGNISDAIEEYEHEYGSTSYDPTIIADMAGVSKSDVEKALPEYRKVYDDSSLLTTNIPFPTKYINVDFDQLAKEFEYDPVTKRIFKIMVKFLKDDKRDLSNITATEVEREYNRINKVNQLSYTAVHKEVKKIIAKVKDAYSYG